MINVTDRPINLFVDLCEAVAPYPPEYFDAIPMWKCSFLDCSFKAMATWDADYYPHGLSPGEQSVCSLRGIKYSDLEWGYLFDWTDIDWPQCKGALNIKLGEQTVSGGFYVAGRPHWQMLNWRSVFHWWDDMKSLLQDVCLQNNRESYLELLFFLWGSWLVASLTFSAVTVSIQASEFLNMFIQSVESANWVEPMSQLPPKILPRFNWVNARLCGTTNRRRHKCIIQ